MKRQKLLLGTCLSNHLETRSTKPRRLELDISSPAPRRTWFFRLVLVLFLIVCMTRLVELQIVKGQYYHDLANSNRIRVIRTRAPRGLIFDRDGKPLVENIPIYKLVKINCQDDCVTNITREEALAKQPLPDTQISFDIGRQYPYSQALAHLLGYLGELNHEELTTHLFDSLCHRPGAYNLGDFVGRTGLEQQYECLLQGSPGTKFLEVDAAGNQVRELGESPPRLGQNLHLNLKVSLQQTAYQALQPLGKGALVATRPQTGEILALISVPSFDPNELVTGKDPQKLSQIFTSSDQLLFNRAISGVYPPGSTFKPITAVAALEETAISPDFTFVDEGVITIGPYQYANWYFTQHGGKEGQIGLVRAIARSTDTFFYKIGEKTGIDQLASWARIFNLGQTTGIDLPGETAGLVPDPQWKQQAKGENWFLGNTYHFSIGQGDILATPLQVNQMTAAIANSGTWCKPHLLRDAKPDCHSLEISPDHLEQVKQGMIGACSPGGTAFPLFKFPIPVACKTGTAEYGDPQKTHAWLTAFAPADSPEIAITALVEGGGEGSRVAAPIVRQVLIEYFNLTEDQLREASAPAAPKPGEAE